MQEQQTIRWRAYEYEHREKNVDWFWVLGIIALTGAIAAIILGNLLFAIVIIIGAFTLALYAIRRPTLIHFEINERGIRIDNMLHPFISLDSFWVTDNTEDEIPKLIIKSKKMLMPYLIIPLDADVPREARNYLIMYLEEEEHAEPLSYKIMEHLGF